jgi:hypothetical protein
LIDYKFKRGDNLNNINALKQYNSKAGELKRLNARLKVIDIKLENWDKLKAATVSDMPMYHDNVTGDKVGEIVASREDLQEERQILELKVAELDCFIINVDTRLNCLKDNFRFILELSYKNFKPLRTVVEEYNKIIGIAEYDTVKKYKQQAIKEFLKIK